MLAAPRSVLRAAERAIQDFSLIAPGDRVAVGVSGGKDSLLLVQTLRALARRTDLPFEFEAVHLDQGQPGFDMAGLEASMAALDVPFRVVDRPTWPIVAAKLEPGQIPCALCARMRRGVLNDWCVTEGFDRLALGHHLDDAVETFFLNLFFQRKLEPMKAATPSETGVTTIRPLILVEERQIIDWVTRSGLRPIACPVCDETPRSSRRDTGAMLAQLRELHPDLNASVRHALYGR